MGLAREFRDFLVKDNALALAIGFIVGAALGKFVTAITDNLLMPVVGIFMPKGAEWETWGFDLVREGNTVKVGAFLSALINLLIIGFVCFLLVRLFIREKAKTE